MHRTCYKTPLAKIRMTTGPDNSLHLTTWKAFG